MLILFFSSLSLAALAGLLALNSAALKAAKARQSSPTKTWDLSPRSSLSPLRGDAKWINNQWVPNAVVAAEAARVAAVKQAEVTAFNAHPVVKIATKTASFCVYTVFGILALVILAIVGFAIGGLLGVFAIKFIALGLLIAWCLNDFKNDIADEVVARQKK